MVTSFLLDFGVFLKAVVDGDGLTPTSRTRCELLATDLVSRTFGDRVGVILLSLSRALGTEVVGVLDFFVFLRDDDTSFVCLAFFEADEGVVGSTFFGAGDGLFGSAFFDFFAEGDF